MDNTKFVLGIFIVILLAKLFPSIGETGGVLKPEITVKYVAVAIIFLNSGLTLPSKDLKAAVLRWDIHLFIQAFTFMVFPTLMFGLVSLLRRTFLHHGLLEGLTILSTLPPPVSSAIILTKAVGGNEAAAVFNSAFGSILGIFTTPSLILMLLDASEIHIPTQKIFLSLMLKCVAPLLIGQLIRYLCYHWLSRQAIPYRTISNLMIQLIVFNTFCNMFSRQGINLDFSSLLFIVIIVILLQLCLMYSLPRLSSSNLLPYSSSDSVTITYCCTHKSLTLGIPVIELIFEGDPLMAFRIIPLLVYGPLQIILGVLSIDNMSSWLHHISSQRRKFTKHV